MNDFIIPNNVCDKTFYVQSSQNKNTPKDPAANQFLCKYGNIYSYIEDLFNKLIAEVNGLVVKRKITDNRKKKELLDTYKNILIGLIFDNYGSELTIKTISDLKLINKYLDDLTFKKVIGSCSLKNFDYYFSLSEKKYWKNIKVDCNNFINRPETTSVQKLMVSLLYAPIHEFLNTGNQLSTFSDELILSISSSSSSFSPSFSQSEKEKSEKEKSEKEKSEKEQKEEEGGGIEVFGSAYNTRLKRYGCMFPEFEAPFGGIGTAEQIFDGVLNGTIKASHLLISPPSSRYLHDLSMRKIRDILTAINEKKIDAVKIVLAISSSKEDMFKYWKLNEFNPKPVTIKNGYYFECSCSGNCKMITKTVPLSFDWTEYYF